MMNKMDDLKSLKETVQMIQQGRYPEIPIDMLYSIIEIGEKYLENTAEAKKNISAVVETFLKEEIYDA